MAAAKQKKAAKPAKTKTKEGVIVIDDARAKTPDQLKELLLQFKKETFNLRFQRAVGEAANPNRKRTLRKNIAKVLTALNEKKPETKNA